MVYRVPHDEMVGIAGLHLISRADSWFCNCSKENRNPSWEQFEEALCKRFGDLSLEDIVEEFMKLSQESTVNEYEDKFEDLRVRMERA